MNTDEAAMPVKEPMTKPSPKRFQAAMKSGMFMMMFITPTGRSVSMLIIMAMPVSPPANTWLG